MFPDTYFSEVFSCEEIFWNTTATLETARQTWSTTQLAVPLSNKHGVRKAVLLMLTDYRPKYPSTKYQLHPVEMLLGNKTIKT